MSETKKTYQFTYKEGRMYQGYTNNGEQKAPLIERDIVADTYDDAKRQFWNEMEGKEITFISSRAA